VHHGQWQLPTGCGRLTAATIRFSPEKGVPSSPARSASAARPASTARRAAGCPRVPRQRRPSAARHERPDHAALRPARPRATAAVVTRSPDLRPGVRVLWVGHRNPLPARRLARRRRAIARADRREPGRRDHDRQGAGFHEPSTRAAPSISAETITRTRVGHDILPAADLRADRRRARPITAACPRQDLRRYARPALCAPRRPGARRVDFNAGAAGKISAPGRA
jgi:hypothetical protein